jgi:elongation factor Ts
MAIRAEDVKNLREQTGLPLMDCKKALTESNGDIEGAIRWLRENGATLQTKRADRATEFGRFGLYFDGQVGAIVELKCESAPVTQNEEFIELSDGLAKQLATGPGASSGEELLDQPSPTRSGQTLRDQRDDLFNRIREVFNVGRMARFDGASGGYLHLGSTVHGVLLEVTGGTADSVKDVCMHIAAMDPAALTKEEIDPKDVETERSILREAALKEGKPENIVDKMVEGRLRNFYAERVLLEQPFVKENSITVGKFAQDNGMSIKRFVHWVIGKE